MEVGSTGSPGFSPDFASRLKSINLQPVVGPTQRTGESSDTSPSSPPDSDDSSESSRRPSISNAPNGDRSNQRGITSEREAPVYDENGRLGSESSEESSASSELSPAEKRKVQELKRVDSRVRSHEQAHLAAAGSFAQGGISFEFVQGPDGNRYAVGGSVQLDASKASTPEETVQKLQRVKQAAMAPADPSPQDLQIAAEASRKLAQAQAESSGEGASGENESSGTESSDGSSELTGSESEIGSSADDGIEGPGDIGIDVNEDVGVNTADQNRTDANNSPNGSRTGRRLYDLTVHLSKSISVGFMLFPNFSRSFVRSGTSR